MTTGIAVSQDTNPFFEEYTAPFGIPPFDKIENEHFMPAFEKGMADHLAEIEAIVNNPEAPTIENTLVALDESGGLLDRVSLVFFNLASSNTNDDLKEIQLKISPMLSAHSDAILLNEKLFERVNAIWEMRDRIRVDRETFRLMEESFKSFKRGGALLSEEEKEELTKINAEIAELSVQFGQNVLEETNAFQLVIEDEADLEGLPESIVAAAAETAEQAGMEGKWIFTPHRSSMYPFLTYSPKRELRKQLYDAYINRGDNDNENDNKLIVARMAALRAQRAQMLGYQTHAHYVLEENMAKEPANVYELLNKLWEPSLERARQEVVDMQAMVDAEGGNFEIAGYDWWYYAEKVRQEKYALDEASMRPYFSLDATLNGVFDVSTRLFGITFERLEGVPLYHEDAMAFEVKDADGSHLGVFICDFYTRPEKRGGAWMSNFREQSNVDESIRPIVVNVCNFPPPVGDEPSLLTFEQVTTLFHEFGHALHSLLSQVKYESLSGTNVPRDYVEFPAQILEHWAGEPEVLENYARHYETGEVIPMELVEKIQKAAKFNQGFANTEYLAAAFLDMDWHTLTDGEIRDTNSFESASLEKIGLNRSEIESRYRSTYFQHIFSGGYSSGYYSYIWSAVLDSDGFEAFKESGDIFNPELAAKYREHVLESGGTAEGMDLYRAFRGAEPGIEPLLRNRGLDGSGE